MSPTRNAIDEVRFSVRPAPFARNVTTGAALGSNVRRCSPSTHVGIRHLSSCRRTATVQDPHGHPTRARGDSRLIGRAHAPLGCRTTLPGVGSVRARRHRQRPPSKSAARRAARAYDTAGIGRACHCGPFPLRSASGSPRATTCTASDRTVLVPVLMAVDADARPVATPRWRAFPFATACTTNTGEQRDEDSNADDQRSRNRSCSSSSQERAVTGDPGVQTFDRLGPLTRDTRWSHAARAAAVPP
jgi:hypothetical protein